MSSIFEKATRRKLRFVVPSNNVDKEGHRLLDVEQVWDLPLQSRRANACTIESLGNAVVRELKSLETESFVSTSSSPRKSELELQLAILEHIRDERKKEAAVAEQAAERAAQRQQILEALGNKEKEAINSLSLDELRARLAELNGEKTETAATS